MSQEELGGAHVHCRYGIELIIYAYMCILINSCFSISGCTDHFAGTESDGLATIRRIMDNLNMKKHSLQTLGMIALLLIGMCQ